MKKRYITLIVISSLIILIISSFFIWASISYKPMEEALDALESTDLVDVSITDYIVFTPKNTTPTTGLIFYPGGKVQPEAYAPLMLSIAEYGFLVIIVPPPFNLAILGQNEASNVISEFQSIDTWAISGHSLGGTVAARYVYQNPILVEGLILYASYPADSNDLSSYNIDVLSIYGSEDLILGSSIEDTIDLLPSAATIVEIIGGNHAYFGWYGEQNGDGVASISRIEQQSIVTNETVTFLSTL